MSNDSQQGDMSRTVHGGGRVVEENRSGMGCESSIGGIIGIDLLELLVGPVLHYLEVLYV